MQNKRQYAAWIPRWERCKRFMTRAEFHGHKVKLINQAIAKYKSLRLALATPASFPDSGYYYARKEREMTEIYEKVIVHLNKRRRILIEHEMVTRENADREAYYGVTENGYSPAEMDAMMAYQ